MRIPQQAVIVINVMLVTPHLLSVIRELLLVFTMDSIELVDSGLLVGDLHTKFCQVQLSITQAGFSLGPHAGGIQSGLVQLGVTQAGFSLGLSNLRVFSFLVKLMYLLIELLCYRLMRLTLAFQQGFLPPIGFTCCGKLPVPYLQNGVAFLELVTERFNL